MAEKQTVQLPDGTTAEAISLPFEVVAEPWHEYAMADGGRIRTRPIATRIFKVLDDEGKHRFNPDGTPVFYVMSTIGAVVYEP